MSITCRATACCAKRGALRGVAYAGAVWLRLLRGVWGGQGDAGSSPVCVCESVRVCACVCSCVCISVCV